ncbi:MAG: cytochrome c3 family protein [Flavobacteriales bacterium]
MHRLSQIAILILVAVRLNAQSPHGEAMKMDCAQCHVPADWTSISDSIPFDHDLTRYPLAGAHAQVDCKSCHASLVFNEAPGQCNACHADIHSLSVGDDCARCHTPKSWVVDGIPELHEENGFPLVGAHGNLSCVDCHASEAALQFGRNGNDCLSCHQSDFSNTRNPDHTGAGFSTDCIRCHDPLSTGWDTEIVDHDFFPLTQGHAISNCSQCHTGGSFTTASPECISCHQDDYAATMNPGHSAAGFSTDCATCHTTSPGWAPATYDHDIYPLVGSHATTSCAQCHNGNYTNTPNTCAGCHLPDYTAATNPNHTAAGFATDCATCHNETAWSPSSYDHSSYPLVGSHATVSCNQCHNGDYNNTPNTCAGCHLPDYNATTNPNHTTAGFATDCATCHNETAWSPSSYDHSSYPLVGSHATVSCNQCHNGDYNNTPNTCNGCHLPDYNAATNPNHIAAQFPTDCAQCHDETAWTPSSYDHNTTGFPLTGGHTGVDCLQCHSNGYQGTPTNCDACHMPEYNATTNPNHAAAQFPTDCALCHDESAWGNSTFDHNNTNFPLTGGHTGVNCIACHSNGYQGTPTNCDACHMPDYNGTINPNHTAAQFATNCTQCHDETAWAPSSYNHNTTGFPLTGGHNGVDCLQCHANGYQGTPSTCDACHMPDYNGTTNPNHAAAQFPTDCAQCHTETAWSPSSYDHSGYPLVGSHATVNCNQCHNGNYNNTPNTCAGCHLPDYNGTTNPNHAAAQFPTDCAICHGETSWVPSTYDHNATGFPLTGGHAGVNCLQCHSNGYQGTPTDCDACHMADYNGTNNPDHQSAQFPTDCSQCHGITAWVPSTFDHDAMYFPIYNGTHDGDWNTCADCHTNPNDYGVFSCIICHDNQGQLANDHSGENGYAYNSAACFNCHPNGN